MEGGVEEDHARGPGHEPRAEAQLEQRGRPRAGPVARLGLPQVHGHPVREPQHGQRDQGAHCDRGDGPDLARVQNRLREHLADAPAGARSDG